MKSLHFCTPEKLNEIRSQDKFTTIRTGWIPQLFRGDVIKINERTIVDGKNEDVLICKARIRHVEPIMRKFLNHYSFKEEIERYNKKFHPDQYFFHIHLEKN